ncbi:transmembrane amino acid transporter protein-domain-containing protein [Jimgerdemannia flammicorona]|uniref:Transmembrane amino acid transporter protein-domain-containing protein n=1 Tax=Jimgerdemannia flammicorona TaxID=994334 RepID=A0A433AUH4_9FUNG|nr:transmembrane amino acid transporter protein-domain-containing protein [Jimgerdemannia flammicorona]
MASPPNSYNAARQRGSSPARRIDIARPADRSEVTGRLGTSPGVFSGSYGRNSSPSRAGDRSELTARLGSSPGPFNNNYNLSSSPARSSSSFHPTQIDLDGGRFFGTSPARSTSGSPAFDGYASDGDDAHGTSAAGPLAIYNEAGEPFAVDLPQEEVARVVKRHLVTAATGDNGKSPSPSLSSNLDPGVGSSSVAEDQRSTPPIRSVHELPGGSITHDLYKWTQQVENAQQFRRNRSQSLYLPREADPILSQLKQPGGFRRHYVLAKAKQEGKKPPNFITKSFVDFLCLYGHFGGEDLSDDEDEDYVEENIRDDEQLVGVASGSGRGSRGGKRPTEQSPLLPRPIEPVQGTASASKAVFLLLKSFVGTGIATVDTTNALQTFSVSCFSRKRKHCLEFSSSTLHILSPFISSRLPRHQFILLLLSFYNGGLLFSTAFLITIAGVALLAFLLLVETRTVVPASFGDMGGILFGPRMRIAVLFSISISQIGFVCAYMVFVSQNVQALIMSLSQCHIEIPIPYLIIAQLFIFVPLAMIRKIAKLSVFALIADVFILVGLLYLYYYEFLTLAKVGIGKVALFNPNDFALFVGTAVFTYEGVGLIIPITEAMEEPQRFPAVLTGTMVFITLLFTSVGFISYLTFGDKVQTVILLNLPSGDLFVDGVQALYSLAICLSIPLQLFPAIRIMENGLFTKSGKNDSLVKWQKNIFRFGTVLVCAMIAIAGASDLDKFVALIGALCCVPLCWFFPPLFHLKAVARTWYQKTIDVLLIIFGIICMIYTTYITVMQWTGENNEDSPSTRCEVHGG